MPNLIVRNLETEVVAALKQRAAQQGCSAESAHRDILRNALMRPPQKSFAQVLMSMPNVGEDQDFERDDLNNLGDYDVFDFTS